jgi:hypothetical protein
MSASRRLRNSENLYGNRAKSYDLKGKTLRRFTLMRSRTGHAQQCSDPPQGMCDSKADYLAVNCAGLRAKLPSPTSEPELECAIGADHRNSDRYASAIFWRNDLSHVFDVLFDFTNLRMHVADQIVLSLRQLFYTFRHLMQLFQHRILTRGDAMHPPEAKGPTERSDAGQYQRHCFEISHLNRVRMPRSSQKHGLKRLRHAACVSLQLVTG